MMRNRSDAWQSALPVREAVRQIDGVQRTTVDWLKWMDGLPPDVEIMIMSLDNSDQAERVIKPFMKRIVVSCDERLPNLEAELASKEAQDPRHPWENWIVELTGLFDQYGLPTPVRTDVDKTDNQSPFTIFICELQELIEKQYRQHDHSIEALAKAINRARSPREGEQARRDE